MATIATNIIFISEYLNKLVDRDFNLQKVDPNLIEQRLKNWSQLLGGEDKLNKRLQWNGWDLNTVRLFLGTADVIDNSAWLAWVETIKEFMGNGVISLRSLEREEQFPIDSENPLPFEDFYLPFILVARRKLEADLSETSSLELLGREAWKSLESNLLKKLANLGAETLLFEFSKFRESQPSYDKNDSQESLSKALYYAFIQNLIQDGGIAFFQQYPVLADLIATTINLWVESTAEFLQRLQDDLSTIELTFSDRKSLGKVKEIETSLSEYHNGGRSVLVLTFSSGIKVVYKPKDLGLDVAFNELLDWCNQQDISLPFKLTKIFNRQGYGWVEFIEHQSCEDKATVQRFYKRAGMLLSLLYILGASKCHKNNVIARGEYPIFIDADPLMSPVVKSFDESEEWFQDSVLKTGFLPAWEGNITSKNTRDSSAIGGIYSQQVNSSKEWTFINTDGMQLTPKTTIIPPRNNVVILEGKIVSPNDYLEEIVMGFEEIYRLLIKHRETFLADNSPLSPFKSLKSRFILRPTSTYNLITQHSLSPQYLRSKVDYSIAIDILSRSYLTAEEKPDVWAILPAEMKSLQQQDIPYFSVSCNSDTLDIGLEQPIKQFFKTSSNQQLISRLQSLDEKDLALQIKLIRGNFSARFTHLKKNHVAAPQGDYSQFLPLTPEQLLQEALSIGNSLVANAVINNDSCNWIAIECMFNVRRYRLQTLDNFLFEGRIGVSLFLAALAKMTGKSEFQQVALAAISCLRHSLKKEEGNQRLIQSELGMTGLGGLIYSLVKISQFLQKPALLEDAKQAAKLITPQAIANDQTLDIGGGVAGAILGLLSLYQETGEQAILHTAIACGDHLLSKRSNTVPRAWKTISKVPLTGFSHGAAGNSLSLLRLYAATANIAYLEAAQEGIEYEQSVFDQSAKDWPDLRYLDTINQVRFNAWCHGSSGIGLARLGSLGILPAEEIDANIQIALENTQNYGVSNRDLDHLCCGNLGRTELFVVASQKLGNHEWLKTARKQAAWVVERAKENGGYTLDLLPNWLSNPSFFRGTAGIGYQLLRLASPELLPSVLIWE